MAKDELKLMRQQATEAQQLQTLLDEARHDIAQASAALTECAELRTKLKSIRRDGY